MYPTILEPIDYVTSASVISTLQPLYGTQACYCNRPPGEWKHGLCECFDDCGECLWALCCPLCYMTLVFSRADESCLSCLLGGLVPLRARLRTERRIDGGIYLDCLTVLCCFLCSLVQMGTELKPEYDS